MDFGEYQELVGRTGTEKAGSKDLTLLAINVLGLNGEAGEVADEVKKIMRHGRQLDVERIALELGDVLWYVAETCRVLGLSLGYVAYRNIEKLQERYPNGFTQRG